MNHAGLAPDYLRALNVCFPRWGDERTYQWVFERRMEGEPKPDQLILRQDGELLAGSGVGYRSIRLANGSEVRAGVMTGSWTLPAARGRGCFSRMIEESLRIATERGAALLLAFVSEENPSRRQLQRAGAALFSSSYLIFNTAKAGPEVASSDLTREGTSTEDAFAKWEKRWTSGTRFVYRSSSDWNSQFASRPWKTELIRAGDGAGAVVEEHPDTDRINALLSADLESDGRLLADLLKRAAHSGRKLFSFSTDPRLTEAATRLGFAVKPGFVAALAANWRTLDEGLGIRPSEATPSSACLSDPADPRYLGQWNLQAGDRI